MVNPYLFGAGATGFEPDNLGSLYAWYDADQLVGSNGDPINTWPDEHSTWDASFTGAAPTLAAAAINGKNAIDFTTGKAYTVGSGFMASGVTQASYFAVFSATNDPASGGASAGGIVSGLTGSGNDSHHPYTDGNIYDGFATDTRKTIGNPTPSLTSTRIYSAHSASADYRAYLDGNSIFSTGTNTVSFGAGGGFLIGRSNTSDFLGRIAEILFFTSALTTSDRQKVEGYLAHKWGLTGNLDAGHPYKSSPP